MYSMYAQVEWPGLEGAVGTGWLPPMPDMRDYTAEHEKIAPMIAQMGIGALKGDAAPKLTANVDSRASCSEIRNQGALGSCTAHAACAMLEYCENRAFSKHIDVSRLYVYKTSRDLLQVTGDTGAWLRTAMAALVLLGAPPEKYWPYTDAKPAFDVEPTAFVYSVADDYTALQYFCHDPLGAALTGEAVLQSVKTSLAARLPAMFGFYGFPSAASGDKPGAIPYPGPGEKAQWGHAILAVGYDDNKVIKNTKYGTQTTGALLFENSWGTAWGEKGFGWLPYDYVRNKLATDFWTLLSAKYVETKQFGLS